MRRVHESWLLETFSTQSSSAVVTWSGSASGGVKTEGILQGKSEVAVQIMLGRGMVKRTVSGGISAVATISSVSTYHEAKGAHSKLTDTPPSITRSQVGDLDAGMECCAG